MHVCMWRSLVLYLCVLCVLIYVCVFAASQVVSMTAFTNTSLLINNTVPTSQRGSLNGQFYHTHTYPPTHPHTPHHHTTRNSKLLPAVQIPPCLSWENGVMNTTYKKNHPNLLKFDIPAHHIARQEEYNMMAETQ